MPPITCATCTWPAVTPTPCLHPQPAAAPLPGLFPCILGHEAAGIVESVGEGVTSVKAGESRSAVMGVAAASESDKWGRGCHRRAHAAPRARARTHPNPHFPAPLLAW